MLIYFNFPQLPVKAEPPPMTHPSLRAHLCAAGCTSQRRRHLHLFHMHFVCCAKKSTTTFHLLPLATRAFRARKVAISIFVADCRRLLAATPGGDL